MLFSLWGASTSSFLLLWFTLFITFIFIQTLYLLSCNPVISTVHLYMSTQNNPFATLGYTLVHPIPYICPLPLNTYTGYYRELKIGHNEMIQAERDERKRQMERVQKNRNNPLYKPVAEQFMDLKPKQVRDSLSPDRLQKLRSTIKPDTTQWTSRGRKADTVSAGIRSLDATVNFTSELEEKYINEEQWLSKTLGPASRTPSPGGLSTRAPGSRAKSPRSKTPMKSPRSNNLNVTLWGRPDEQIWKEILVSWKAG